MLCVAKMYLVRLVVEYNQIAVTDVESRQMITCVLGIKDVFIDDKCRATRLRSVTTNHTHTLSYYEQLQYHKLFMLGRYSIYDNQKTFSATQKTFNLLSRVAEFSFFLPRAKDKLPPSSPLPSLQSFSFSSP